MRFLDLSTEYSVQYSQYFTPNKGSERVLLTPYGSSGLVAKIFWVGRGGQWGLGSGLVKTCSLFRHFPKCILASYLWYAVYTRPSNFSIPSSYMYKGRASEDPWGWMCMSDLPWWRSTREGPCYKVKAANFSHSPRSWRIQLKPFPVRSWIITTSTISINKIRRVRHSGTTFFFFLGGPPLDSAGTAIKNDCWT
jgi:hypothetical protein